MSRMGTNRRQATLSLGFRASLRELTRKLKQSRAHFVRCIKPNADCQPGKWDTAFVQRQLEYCGMMATVQVRKLGYSFRPTFQNFVEQFRFVASAGLSDQLATKETCVEMLKMLGIEDYVLGKTKVFLREQHKQQLETAAHELARAAVFIQKHTKGWIARVRTRPLVMQSRAQAKTQAEFWRTCQKQVSAIMVKCMSLDAADEREKEKRTWLKQEPKKTEKRKSISDYPVKEWSKMHQGFRVLMVDEGLDIRVGKLQEPWTRERHPKSNRWVYRNSESGVVSWVDPRTVHVRPQDVLLCESDALPYGWEECETKDGVTFYVDHVTGTHHHLHPRLAVQQTQKQRKRRTSRAEHKISHCIKDQVVMLRKLRVKRQRLVLMLAQAYDSYAHDRMQRRLTALDKAIDKHQAELTHIKEHVKVVVDKSIAKTQRHQLEETNKASTSSLDTSANAPRTT
eukprot:m.131268 g.131268  ORF g.131268 m.131268 type:complete len:454 (-) comp16810_c0_seq7:63-1424(-)